MVTFLNLLISLELNLQLSQMVYHPILYYPAMEVNTSNILHYPVLFFLNVGIIDLFDVFVLNLKYYRIGLYN